MSAHTHKSKVPGRLNDAVRRPRCNASRSESTDCTSGLPSESRAGRRRLRVRLSGLQLEEPNFKFNLKLDHDDHELSPPPARIGGAKVFSL